MKHLQKTPSLNISVLIINANSLFFKTLVCKNAKFFTSCNFFVFLLKFIFFKFILKSKKESFRAIIKKRNCLLQTVPFLLFLDCARDSVKITLSAESEAFCPHRIKAFYVFVAVKLNVLDFKAFSLENVAVIAVEIFKTQSG